VCDPRSATTQAMNLRIRLKTRTPLRVKKTTIRGELTPCDGQDDKSKSELFLCDLSTTAIAVVTEQPLLSPIHCCGGQLTASRVRKKAEDCSKTRPAKRQTCNVVWHVHPAATLHLPFAKPSALPIPLAQHARLRYPQVPQA
jgi:hypothetical protein